MVTQCPQGSSPFKISGLPRRQLKKRLATLKMLVRMSHFHNDVDTVYGGGQTQEELEQTILRWKEEIEEIKTKLNENRS